MNEEIFLVILYKNYLKILIFFDVNIALFAYFYTTILCYFTPGNFSDSLRLHLSELDVLN